MRFDSYWCMGHGSFICGARILFVWDMTHLYAEHDSFIRRTWLIRSKWRWVRDIVRFDSWCMAHKLIHMWDKTHSYVGHDSFICGTWLIHMWDMTHLYVGHDSFWIKSWSVWEIVRFDSWCMGKLFHKWDIWKSLSYMRHDLFICGTWPIRSKWWCICEMVHFESWYKGHDLFVCGTRLLYIWDVFAWYVGHDWDMTYSCVGHDSFVANVDVFVILRPLIPDVWDMTHLYMGHGRFICGHDLFIYGTWLIYMWDTTPSYAGHDSFVCVTWQPHMWDMTPSHVGHNTFIRGTWLNICGTWLIIFVGHNSFICGTWTHAWTRTRTHKHTHAHTNTHTHTHTIINLYSVHYQWWQSRSYVCDVTHSYARHDSFVCVARLFHMYAMVHLWV